MELLSIENKIIKVQGKQVILDSDVADLYGVETKRINEAVKNNPDKFPEGYILYLSMDEANSLRSKCKKRRRLLQQNRSCCYSSEVAKLMFFS